MSRQRRRLIPFAHDSIMPGMVDAFPPTMHRLTLSISLSLTVGLAIGALVLHTAASSEEGSQGSSERDPVSTSVLSHTRQGASVGPVARPVDPATRPAAGADERHRAASARAVELDAGALARREATIARNLERLAAAAVRADEAGELELAATLRLRAARISELSVARSG